MSCQRPHFILILCAMLAVPEFNGLSRAAAIQQQGLQWQHDIESAKATARQTGKLVLVHFWAHGCPPCVALESMVFNQPSVASAIESQFVPVKLNADENPATATGFGLTRVPTDVVLTPEGQVVGKLISPPTPSAYISEVSQIAAQYARQTGHRFATANERFQPPPLNAAYANLQIAPTTPAALEAQRPAINDDRYGATPAFAASTGVVAVGDGMAAWANGASSAAVADGPAQLAPNGVPSAWAPTPPQLNAAPSGTAASDAASSVAPQPAPVQTVNPYVAAMPQPTAAQQVNPYDAVVAQQHYSAAQTVDPYAPVTSSPTTTQAVNPNAAVTPPSIPPTPALSTPTVAPAPESSGAPIPSVAGAPAQQGASTTDARQLTPAADAPPVGFDGYCPVSMRRHWKWVPGDPKWAIIHRGRTYYLAGRDEHLEFWNAPDRYSPALSGLDPVLAIDHRQQVPGKREHSLDYDNLFYMFASEATLQQFTANPERYATSVRQAMGIERGQLVR